GAGGGSAHDSEVDPDLLAQLQDGGEVLLFRHALTDTTQVDADPSARGSCAQQRNLSAEGRAQATRIGQAIRDLGLSVGPVYASPYCRTLETATAIGADAVTSDALLSLTAAPSTEDAAAIVEQGRQLILAELGGDDLAVAVTHTQNVEALTDVLVEEGDAVVLGAGADGQFEVLGTISADDW
ncbi:MAG TPA: histidine phosphatase family protein, partial [Euzebya sp.]|nr:histidine phosphatase family protein [Euzebya sp.]